MQQLAGQTTMQGYGQQSFVLERLRIEISCLPKNEGFEAASEGGLGVNLEELSHNITGRIINGQDVTSPERYPYYVSLLNSNYRHVCGGSLIAPDTVLTAAHCNGNLHYAVVGLYARSNRGAHEFIPIKSTHPHELFGHAGLSFDQMVVMLTRSSRLSTPVKVNLESNVPQGQNAITVVGFGSTDAEKGTLPEIMQKMDGTYISNDACNILLGDRLEDDMMCMQGQVDENLQESRQCNGDSGGPWILPGNGPEEDLQVATVSWGVRGCKPEYPNVGSRTTSSDWITKVTCAESASPPAYFGCPTQAPTNYPSVSPSETPSFLPHDTLREFQLISSDVPSDAPVPCTFHWSEWDRDGGQPLQVFCRFDTTLTNTLCDRHEKFGWRFVDPHDESAVYTNVPAADYVSSQTFGYEGDGIDRAACCYQLWKADHGVVTIFTDD